MNEIQINTTTLYRDVAQILLTARQKTYSAINSEMVKVYWQMGKRIVEEEQKGSEKAAYGEAILKNLSVALTAEFGKGFSYPNLRNFRQFYLTYPMQEICYTLCSKLTWSHNRLIMRVEDINARNYYLEEAAQQNWSVRTLERSKLFATKYMPYLPTEAELIAETYREKRLIEAQLRSNEMGNL